MQSSSNLWDIAVLIFAGLVAIGILGEVFCSVGSVFKHLALQRNEKAIESERNRIEDEKDRDARANSERLALEIAAATKENLELQKSLELERQKTVTLYEKMRWRHLTSNKFFLTLQGMHHRGELSVRRVWYSVQDPEAEAFATEIMNMAIGAQMSGSGGLARYSPSERSDQNNPDLRNSFMPKGVCIFTCPGENNAHLDEIFQSLRDSGVSFTTEAGNVDPGYIDIEVDCNPAAFLDIAK